MKHIVLGAAALLALGIVGCESNTHDRDNDMDNTEHTTSTRIDSGTVSNDRMNTGNTNDRTRGSSSSGSSTTIDRNSGIDRAGGTIDTGTDINRGGTTGTGSSSSGAGTGR